MMQKSKVEKMSHLLDRRTSDHTGRDSASGTRGAHTLAGSRGFLATLFALLAATALVLGLGFAGPFASEAEAQEEEVECTTVTEITERELTIPLNIATGREKDVRRFTFDGLKAGETVAGLKIENSKKEFSSDKVDLIVNQETRELFMIAQDTGTNLYEFERVHGELGDGNQTLTLNFNPARKVSKPIGSAYPNRIQMDLPITDTAKKNYTVTAFVQTERKECTTKQVPTSTTSAEKPEPMPEPQPTDESPEPEPTPEPNTPEPSSEVTSPAAPEDEVCVTRNVPVNDANVQNAQGHTLLNHEITFNFGNFYGQQHLSGLQIESEATFGTQPFQGENWRFEYGGRKYEAGTDFTVSPATGRVKNVRLTFHNPVALKPSSSASLFTTLTSKPGAVNVTATGSNCAPEALPADPSTENPRPSETDEAPATTEPPAPADKATERRDPREGEQRLSVSARAFMPMYKDTAEKFHNSRNSTDTRYTEGIRFELWAADNDLGDALRKGPEQKIEESWAYCVTDATGECHIFVPESYLGNGKRFYVKQVSNAPGTFHIDRMNWGKYGRADDRFEAYLPGPTDLVEPGGRNVQERTYEVPKSDKLSGDTVQSINSDLKRPVSQWSSFGSSVQSLNNPPLEQARKCQASGGPKIALVMDVTASIKNDGDPAKYREAVYGANGFLESLRGTGAEVAMFNFNESSPGKGQNYPELLSVDTSMDTLKQQAQNSLKSFSDGTNWESGLEEVKTAIANGQDYDEVIFITDGDANGYGKNGSSGDYNDGRSGYIRAIEAAVYRANDIKAGGTRIVSIGVGSADDAPNWDGSGQLEAISGPVYGVDYFGTDWDRLAATLRAAASQVTCQNEIVVDKTIVDEYGRKLADQSEARDWNVDIHVDKIVSEVNWDHGEVPAAVLSPNSTTKDDTETPLTLRDRKATPDSRWFLTFYGDPEPGSGTSNRADITLTEDVNSRPGYSFVPGTGLTRSGGYIGRGSWYEIRDLRHDTVIRTGPVKNPTMKFPKMPQDRKLIVHLQNQPSVAVQKGAAQSAVTVSSDNTWTAKYEVRAQGTSNSETSIPRITDKPQFPDGFKITSVKVDGQEREYVNGEFEVAAEGSRAVSSNFASYSVEISGVYDRRDALGNLVPIETLGDELTCRADGSTGPGRGLFNQVFMDPDIDGPDNNRACIPIVPNQPKNPTVEKSFVDVKPAQGSVPGEQIVTYNVTVKGDPESDLNFDLTDKPAFPAGTTVHAASARYLGGSQDGSPGLGRSMKPLEKNDSGAWAMASGTIPAQGVFEYEIQFRTAGFENVEAKDRKCVPNGANRAPAFQANKGLHNVATIAWTSDGLRRTLDDDACGDIEVSPQLELRKTVDEYPYTVTTDNGDLHADRSSALQYRIEVENTGTGPGIYTLVDTPLFANGVEALGDHTKLLAAQSVNSANDNVIETLPGFTAEGVPQHLTFGKDVKIAPGTTHVYTFQIGYGEKQDFFSNENRRDSVCAATPGDQRKGLNNKAQLTNVKNGSDNTRVAGEFIDYACSNIPPQPQILKDIVNEEELQQNDTVKYDVTVANPSGGVTRLIDVTDTPKFGSKIQTESVSVDGEKVKDYKPGAEIPLGRTVKLEPGESKTFRVEAKYKTPSGEANPDKACSTSSYGLNNTGNIYFAYFPEHQKEGARPRLSDKDDACGLVRAELKLGVQKFGAADGKPEQFEPTENGYGFAVREAPDGTATANNLLALDTPEEDGGYKFSTAELTLKLDTPYELVETKAPKGYSLLAAPVRFKIVDGEQGIQVLFQDGENWVNKLTNIYSISAGTNGGLQLIAVTDVHSGELPRTGGRGIGIPIAIGLALVALGAAFGFRRKNA